MNDEIEIQISDILMKRIAAAAAEHGVTPGDIIPVLISQGLYWRARQKGMARIKAVQEAAAGRAH